MKISVEHAYMVSDRLRKRNEDLYLMGAMYSYDGELLLEEKEMLSREKIELLVNHHHNYVEVYQTEALIEELTVEQRESVFTASQKLKGQEIENELLILDWVNRYSGYRREVVLCEDVLSKERNLLLEYGEKLLLSKWRRVMQLMGTGFAEKSIRVQRSEFQIGVLVNVYLFEKRSREKFLLNMEMLSNLMSMEGGIEKSLFEGYDVIRDLVIIDRPEELLQTYKENHIKLLIIREIANPLYRKHLIELKKYDPYVRILIVDEKMIRDRKKFYKEVIKAYGRDLWK